MIPTGFQNQAERGLVGMSQADLAVAAGVAFVHEDGVFGIQSQKAEQKDGGP